MRGFSQWVLALFTSPAGVVVLAALDSTIFFSFPFGIDAAVVILAARLGGFAWVVPLLATGGSVAGAALTFWMGVEIGERGLDRYLPEARLKKVRERVRRSGAVTLAVLDLIPPPFPFTPFVLAAGALEVKTTLFFTTLTVCRMIRFGGEALLAHIYGRHILGWLESDLVHDIVGVCTILAALLTVGSVVKAVRMSRGPRRHRSAA
jgi:membrane protein YqaA with SNARE-associated domain